MPAIILAFLAAGAKLAARMLIKTLSKRAVKQTIKSLLGYEISAQTIEWVLDTVSGMTEADFEREYAKRETADEALEFAIDYTKREAANEGRAEILALMLTVLGFIIKARKSRVAGSAGEFFKRTLRIRRKGFPNSGKQPEIVDLIPITTDGDKNVSIYVGKQKRTFTKLEGFFSLAVLLFLGVFQFKEEIGAIANGNGTTPGLAWLDGDAGNDSPAALPAPRHEVNMETATGPDVPLEYHGVPEFMLTRKRPFVKSAALDPSEDFLNGGTYVLHRELPAKQRLARALQLYGEGDVESFLDALRKELNLK